MNNYTNKEIVAAVAQTNKNIAEFVNYAEHADGNYTMAELSQFETAPSTVYNEFLGVLVNKIVVQRNYTILGGWENPYSIFYKPTSALGDTEELLAVDLLDGEDYSETSSLLSVQKPDVFNHYIYTEEKKVWKVSIALHNQSSVRPSQLKVDYQHLLPQSLVCYANQKSYLFMIQ